MRPFKIVFAIVFLQLFAVNPLFSRQSKDTTYIRRPTYFGIYANYGNWFLGHYDQYEHELFANVSMNQIMRNRYGQTFQTGLSFSRPFLRKWYYEGSLGVSTTYHEEMIGHVTQISTDSLPEVMAFNTHFERDYKFCVNLGWFFLYEIRRKEKFTVCALAGFGIQGIAMGGLGVGMDGYLNLSASSVLRFRFMTCVGVNTYYNCGIAYCFQGSRYYRVHPDHYYIRTYEEGE